MAELKITQKHLTIHLSWWEKIGARRSHLTVPLRAIRDIQVVDDALGSVEASGARGLTRIPGLFVAGTHTSERDEESNHENVFSVCRRKDPGLVIELDKVSIGRIVVSTQDARRYASELTPVH
ncbi:hypothetical protein HMPREF0290_2944 [Corynebacterium efficiens YS-314]|uniref:Uncharacterized protein n=1 Tax=Corynebacterium efficiens (strain DSM 44549 / YS-314 / AJ 12310 / JCM 11189 / NBRC 100395) TaxID=196164 RepID=Q8FSF6_COREF|nr:hypothetical protein [Corynebacterium efficiens]EEW48428.1 hypothetical protein HMPREF0290_2944 [Corynebacterium efficiens YS-314]BAC17247.1 hypothetical protein [Corynebacterium efficiens YS-314]